MHDTWPKMGTDACRWGDAGPSPRGRGVWVGNEKLQPKERHEAEALGAQAGDRGLRVRGSGRRTWEGDARGGLEALRPWLGPQRSETRAGSRSRAHVGSPVKDAGAPVRRFFQKVPVGAQVNLNTGVGAWTHPAPSEHLRAPPLGCPLSSRPTLHSLPALPPPPPAPEHSPGNTRKAFLTN